MNTLELRRKRAALVEQARTPLNAANAQNRDLNSEERTQYDAIMADVDSFKARIDREEAVTGIETELERSVREPMRPGLEGQAPRSRAEIMASDEYRDAFRASLVADIPQLGMRMTDAQRAILANVRAQAVGTASAGGYTVPTGFRAELEKAEKAFGGVEENASVITTDSGNDLPWPTVNDTSNTGELVGENASVTGQDVTFGSVTLKAFKFSSKTILIPFELLQDNAVNLDSEIAGIAGERLGRTKNTYFTTGTGTNQPQGIVTFSTAGPTAASTSAIAWSELTDLEHSIDPAYRKGAKYMFADSTLKALKKLVDSDGRPLWVPGVAVREPDTINGYEYVINQDMAAIGAAAKSVLFGQLGKYKVRRVMDFTLYRIVDKYIESGQVGFLVYTRADGRGLNAGTNPIKHLVQAAS